MEKTNANDFRANLKEWMEAAQKEPVKITRKNGESFILLNADEFEKIQIELANLRGISKGLSEALGGQVLKASRSSTSEVIKRAKDQVRKKQKKSVS